MGQPDTVNQLPDCARLLDSTFDAEKWPVEPYNTLSLDILPTNEVKGVAFSLLWNIMLYTSVEMSKIMTKFQFTPGSLLRFLLPIQAEHFELLIAQENI